MMLHTVDCNGKELTYELCRKSVKNINLRIRADGSVAVSANSSVTVKAIESFIRTRADYIFSSIDKFKRLSDSMPRLCSFADGERFSVLGEIVTLRVERGDGSVTCDNNVLSVHCGSDAECERLVTGWLNALCRETVEGLCREYYPHFSVYCASFPELRFRKMTSRWGSCQVKKRIITFNYALIETPMRFIEYVVVHELAHFVEPNHSPRFYAVVSELLPDWREVRRL